MTKLFSVLQTKYIHVYLIIQLRFILEHRLSSLNIEQDVREGSDGVLVPPHHHIYKSYIVVSRDLTSWNS